MEQVFCGDAGAGGEAVPGDIARFLQGHGQADRVGAHRALARISEVFDPALVGFFAVSQPFVEENFDFYGRTLSGTKEIQPRWRRCSSYADIDLGDAVGQAYVARYFPPASKERMVQMVKTIEGALGADIDAAEVDVGGNEEEGARQAGGAGGQDRVSGSLAELLIGGNQARRFPRERRSAPSRFELQRGWREFGKPVDRLKWGMTPPTVNAYEDAQTNTINFPAGILQPPFFDAKLGDAVNYGGDRSGDRSRDHPRLTTTRDASSMQPAICRTGGRPRTRRLRRARQCIADEYTQDVPEAGVKQNGKLSLGEDTADNGGVHIALSGLQSALKSQGKELDSPADGGVTELQTFFLAYANVWCGENRPEAARTAVMTQGHSLNRYRINNVVGNMSEFAHAFGCKAGQSMVRANACRVW